MKDKFSVLPTLVHDKDVVYLETKELSSQQKREMEKVIAKEKIVALINPAMLKTRKNVIDIKNHTESSEKDHKEYKDSKTQSNTYEMTLYKYTSYYNYGDLEGWSIEDISKSKKQTWAYPITVEMPNEITIKESLSGEKQFFKQGQAFAYSLQDNGYGTAPILVGNGEVIRLKLGKQTPEQLAIYNKNEEAMDKHFIRGFSIDTENNKSRGR